MPITKTPAFQTSDGNTYANLEFAQRAELLKLLTDGGDDNHSGVPEVQANLVLQKLFDHLDDVKNILRASGRKPRKAKNGATRKRKMAAAEREEAK